ncbi:HupE/UreJ family protein [Flavobacterium sp. SUN052]|uniref:HupE/UreJ family protein n=1 Tax=Flavobacterium sp. SUN052 TaxID=3002441 RepID=UPI00237DF611|nr:HupE/UreJ family protein [Flavobacterium sp. SUN052]MEC4004531.1 HupE/UreJ family protein [Flavobacterium sp. SUN052]
MKNKIYILLFLIFTNISFSHPLPNSTVNVSVKSKSIFMLIKIPLQDFEIALKSKVNQNDSVLISNYFKKHIQIEDKNHQFWKIKLLKYKIQPTKSEIVGKYDEIVFELNFYPNLRSNNRDFTLHYDAILHEIINQKALIYIASDWENGVENQNQQIGIIELDVPTNTIYPLHISLEKGSNWKGFKSMISLGMKHISEGIDHLLFVLVLLLPAPLLVTRKKWSHYGGIKYTLKRLLKVITAFTIGHSFTLLISTLGWITLPSQPIEILIAISILISAIHAIKPLFYGKEMLVAGGFGLVHGLAFASVLEEFELENTQLLLSILGFNIGIELMQLFVVLLFIPSILILSKFPIYNKVKIVGASLILITSIGWILERISGKSNQITGFIDQLKNGIFVFALTLFIIVITYFLFKKKSIVS